MKRIVVLLVATVFAFAALAEAGQTNDFVAVRIDGKDLRRSDVVRNAKVALLLNMNKARK